VAIGGVAPGRSIAALVNYRYNSGAALLHPVEIFLRAAGIAEARLIIGLGLDIAEIDRIGAAIERHGPAFIERIYTTREIAYCESHRNRFERYAARFAAKEAAMKALGTGWRHGVRWRDIEVARDPSGKPALRLEGVAREIADRLGVKNIALTITHSGNLALAQVVFEN
jgi:holo-[acyl-carrier protein] synthase